MENNQTIKMRLRSTVRSVILDILGSFSNPAPGIHILNGHRRLLEKEPDTFEQLLEYLSRKVQFVRIEEAVQNIIDKRQPTCPQVAFTFDDGFMDCYDFFAPTLEKYNVNALLFVNPSYVDGDDAYIDKFNSNIVMTLGKRPMRWKELKALSDRGHIIGAHTMNHFMINSEDENVLNYEIVNCKKIIEQHLGKPCEYFAFPYGKLSQANKKSIDIACKTYRYVFSQSDYKHYFSFGGRVINRRHFEPFWPNKHLDYFLSCKKTFK